MLRARVMLAVTAVFGGPAHIVVSSAAADGGIVVLDENGANPHQVPGVTQVNNLALAPDGRVWATVATGSVVSFSPQDPVLTVESHPIDALCPYDLAVASDGNVWFSAGCASGDDGGLYVLDPAAEDHVTHVTSGWRGGLLSPRAMVENGYLQPDTICGGQRLR